MSGDVLAIVFENLPTLLLALSLYVPYLWWRNGRLRRKRNEAEAANIQLTIDRDAAKAVRDRIASELEGKTGELVQARAKLARVSQERDAAVSSAAELRHTVHDLKVLVDSLHHEVPKRLAYAVRWIERNLPEEAELDEATRDLGTTIEKVRLLLAPSMARYVSENHRTGSGADAAGKPIAEFSRWIAKTLDAEHQVDVKGDLALGMRSKRVFWDLILTNLISNALEHVSEKGRVCVTIGRQPNGFGFVEVYNDGQGIAPAVATHVFTRGYTTRENGRGLGLSVAREVAQGLGADIESPQNVRNRFGIVRGVRFRVVNLPVLDTRDDAA